VADWFGQTIEAELERFEVKRGKIEMLGNVKISFEFADLRRKREKEFL